jgi:23S rRNA (uracil1939-C5)-methyltransferase
MAIFTPIMGRRKKSHPVLENLTIDSAGAEGKAIARHENQVVFVTGVVPGDVVDVQITRTKKSYSEGKPVKFHTYSDKRIEPICEHFGVCGGCKWQHMGYADQLFYKQQQVEDNFTRLGGFEFPAVSPILGSKDTSFYRNKMEFTFCNKKWLTHEQIKSDEVVEHREGLGFHIPGMFDKIVHVNKCHLQADPSNEIRNWVYDYAIKAGLTFYNVNIHEGLLRTLILRSSSTGQWMVIFTFGEDQPAATQALLKAFSEHFSTITSVNYVVNLKKNDTIFDQEVICFAGEDHIMENMEGIHFKIGPKSFYQTNSDQAYELYKITRDFAGLTGEEVVYDLYTGTGTIANFVAKQAKKVVGVEYVPEAIEDAWVNAELNKQDNMFFTAGDMKDVLTDDFVNEHGKPEVIITDPPRAGMHEDVVKQIIKISPEKIVYVSCNPATQARDIAWLSEHYTVEKVQPVDMFPQTHHVENVVLLKKK